MMSDRHVIAVILAIGATSYALRAGGYLSASLLPRAGLLPRVLQLAPGNLFAAFAAAGICEGGWPSLCGCLASATAMAFTRREWVALAAGFTFAAASAAVLR
jgi:hypothetical protein